jgi:glycosyltransferase involved in cell wall biosynthesis
LKVLFLYLKAFSATGGIEKFNRSFLKALHELSVEDHFDADACSPYDAVPDEKYFPQSRFKGYKSNRALFVLGAFLQGLKYDVVIVGHINLGMVGYWLKKVRPSVKLIVVAHGLEVWEKQQGIKRRLLETADMILAVSNYTRQKILEVTPAVDRNKIKIFPNTVDPYFSLPTAFKKPSYLLNRYQFDPGTLVLLTVTRLSFTEKYKGYDNVIALLPELTKTYPKLKYLLCGSFDENERRRIVSLVDQYHANDQVVLPGFISEKELIDHYLLADVFAMPSKKEGFGIVFIEALACGCRVIAGSKDGSVDALMNGQFGKLVDPEGLAELKGAIIEFLNGPDNNPLLLQTKVMDAFGFVHFKERLKNYIKSFRTSLTV